MKKILTAVIILVSAFTTKAQDVKATSPDNKKMNDYDEIIIKKKDGAKDGKVTIEIKDEKVIVDGKPIEDYSGDEFIIKNHHLNSYSLSYPATPFRMDGPSWNMDEEGNDMDPGGERAFLGVMTENSENGAKILDVTEASAADKAGLKKGDVITKVDDQTISGPEQLTGYIATRQPKDKITVTYKRENKENNSSVVLGGRKISRTRTFNSRGPNNYSPHDLNIPRINFDFDNLLDKKRKLGIMAQDTEEGKGVKVVEVDEDSPAGKAGLKEEDIITSFEGKEVNSADELAKASREAKDKSTLKIQFKRNGKSQALEVKIPRKLKTAEL